MRHLLDSNLVGDASALDERVLLLTKLGAQIFNLLMFVENLQFLEVEIPLFELKPFAGFFLDQSLSLPLDLYFFESGFFCFSHLAPHLCLFLPDLSRQLDVVFSAFLSAQHRRLLLGVVVVGDRCCCLPLRLLVLLQGLLPLGQTFKQKGFSLQLFLFLVLFVPRYLVLNATCLRSDSLTHAHAHHHGFLFVLVHARLDHFKCPLSIHAIVPFLDYASCVCLFSEERIGSEVLSRLFGNFGDCGFVDVFFHLSLRLPDSFAVLHDRALLQLFFLNLHPLPFLVHFVFPLVESGHVLLPFHALFLFVVFLFLFHFLQTLC